MPFMTCRIVDVKGALEQIPYPKDVSGSLVFHTEDPLADWNTGTFALTVSDGKGTVTAAPHAQADASMPIGTLALLVFGAMDVNDLVFCEKLQGTDEALKKLEAFFPTEKCYINEWY